jgi:mannosyltransferase
VLLAALLRLATLGVQSFSDDEQFTVWLIRLPFGDMVTTVPKTEATPHLYYVLAWLCAQLFGTGEVGVRILPALLGTLTVPVVYRAGALAASRRVGLAAAMLAAVNPFLIWYSQEARAYALVILLTAVALMCFLSFLRTGAGAPLVGWSLAGAAALATHYFAAFVLLPQAAWLLLTDRPDRVRRAIAISLPAATSLLLLPLALHQRSVVGDPGGVGPRGLGSRLVATPKNFLVGYSIPLEAVVVVAACALGAFALMLAWRESQARERRIIALTGAIAGLAVLLSVLLAAVGLDYVTSRNLIVALVPAIVVLGCGFAKGSKGLLALCALCALLVATVVAVAAEPRYQRRNWRGAAHALGPPRVDRALFVSPGFSRTGPFSVYFGPSRLIVARTMRVREIVVVVVPGYRGRGPGAGKPPVGTSPRAPAGFRLRRDISTATYRIVFYSATHPVTINVNYLRPLAFQHMAYTLVFQRGSHRSSR